MSSADIIKQCFREAITADSSTGRQLQRLVQLAAKAISDDENASIAISTRVLRLVMAADVRVFDQVLACTN